jgi:hypothetical protein
MGRNTESATLLLQWMTDRSLIDRSLDELAHLDQHQRIADTHDAFLVIRVVTATENRDTSISTLANGHSITRCACLALPLTWTCAPC